MPRPPPRSTYSSATPRACSSPASRPTKARRVAQRLEARDLRADVDVDRDEPQERPAGHRVEQLARRVDRHAELVDLQAGRDVRMAPGVDVRVDADGDAARPSRAPRQSPRSRSSSPADSTLIAFRPSGTAHSSSSHRLADAGEDDVARRRSRRAARPRSPRSSWRRRRCRGRAAAARSPSVELALSA